MNTKPFRGLCKKILDAFEKHQVSFSGQALQDTNNMHEFFFFLIDETENEDINAYIEDFLTNQENGRTMPAYPDDILNGKESLRHFFKPELTKTILAKREWNLSLLFINGKTDASNKEISNVLNNLSTDLTEIYAGYFPLCDIPSDNYDLLMELFHSCLLLLDDVRFKNERTESKYHIPTPEASIGRFRDVLKKHPKLLLEGMAGCGKTIFIKDFLQSFPDMDACYVSYQNSLENTLSQIKFDSSAMPSSDEICKRLAQKPVSSLLVIDGMNLKADALSAELAKLCKLHLHVVVITRNMIEPGTDFYQFPSPSLDDEGLIALYQKTSGSKELLPPGTKDLLLSWTHRNTLLVSLLGYAARKSPRILDNLFSGKSTLSSLPKEQQKFKHPYDRITKTLMGHAQEIYDISPLKQKNSVLRNYLKILCLFYNAAIPIPFLEDIIPEFEFGTLERLSEFGYLDFIGDCCVYIPPLFADVIYNVETTSFSELLPTINALRIYLQNNDVQLDKPPVIDLLLPLIERLQPLVTLKNNPNQKYASNNQEIWWSFVYVCIEYCQSMGNYKTAEEIAKLLQYPDKEDIMYKRSHTDQSIFCIINSWYDNNTQFDTTIDNALCEMLELELKLHNDPDNYKKYMPNPILLNYLATNTLNMFLLRLAKGEHYISQRNYRALYKGTWEEMLPYLKFLPEIMQNYYNYLYTLLCSSFDDFNNFFNCFYNTALQYKNIKLRLQLLAAVAVRCNMVIEENIDNTGICIRTYRLLIGCVLPQLTATIKTVSFLPKYTFKLCFYVFAFNKCSTQCEANESFISSQADFQSLIEKCPTLSDSEKEKCLNYLQLNVK